MIPIIKPWIGAPEVEAVARAINSGWIAQGPMVDEFEKALASHLGAVDGVAVSSCTAGLHLVLHALGIGPGDEVVVPSLSFIATANAPRFVGAKPVFADVDPVTFNLTADQVGDVITPRTRAVLLVHQLGMPADVLSFQAVCEPRGIELIEDAACAMGSTYRGNPIGQHSKAVVFSFHPRKLLTTGEGGMVMTPDRELAERLRRLRQHGMSVSAFDRHGVHEGPPTFNELGFNFRLTDIQAAMGLAQLSKLDALIENRRRQADLYKELLGGVDVIRTPHDPPWGTTNFQSYAVVVSEASAVDRDTLMHRLADHGVSTRQGVMAAHREESLARYRGRDLPATETIADCGLILPLFHEMTSDQQVLVADAIQSALA